MTLATVAWLCVCIAGGALSIRSVTALRGRSPLTIVGWLATLAYFAIAGIAAARGVRAPAFVDDVALGVLALAFVIAGFRDEPQAEPWWWPSHAGPTGRERRDRNN